ncbi:MAG: phosphatidylinositol-specific phospholipase C domain-containing protein [Oscillospiraceae bacterium]|nr:phosphatidylinositol-specific phospholipase C domain-containing protein [Oscillospiraceae bacterium]
MKNNVFKSVTALLMALTVIGAGIPMGRNAENIALTASAENTFSSEYQLTGDELNDVTVRIRPAGSYSALAINQNGAGIQNAVHMFQIGDSSRFYLKKADDGSYYIYFYNSAYANSYVSSGYCMFDVVSDNSHKKDGGVIHVVKQGTQDYKRWQFIRQEDGTYYIQNKYSGMYWSLDTVSGINSNNNKLVQRSAPMKWEIEIVNSGSQEQESTKAFDSYNFDNQNGQTVTSLNWMSLLPDDTALTDISIPGTHDSATCNVQYTGRLAQCQQLYIDDMLDSGIRYLDLRLGTSGNSLKMIHGVDNCLNRDGSQLYLDTVMNWVDSFLTENSGETVILQLKDEDGDSTNLAYSYFKNLAETTDKIYIGDHVPTLGEVRGKIVIISRLSLEDGTDYSITKNNVSGLWAIPADNWQIGENNSSALVVSGDDYELWTQDNYDMNASDKWTWVNGSVTSASEKQASASENGKKAWVISYTSVSKLLSGVYPLSAARDINKNLKTASWWEETPDMFTGVVCSDFVDEQLAQMIYQTNFAE